MNIPAGLESLDRPRIQWAAVRRAALAKLRECPDIDAPTLAAHLETSITTTRNRESVARLIGAAVANLTNWRRRI